MQDSSNCDISNCDISKNKINIRKRLRNILVNFVIDISRLTGLTDYTMGYIIKILHFIAPWHLLFNAITLPSHIAPIIFIPFFFASGLFVLLKGCFLTVVEFKLCKDDYNIVDPYIYLFNQQPTKSMRYKFTLGGMIIHFIAVISIFTISPS